MEVAGTQKRQKSVKISCNANADLKPPGRNETGSPSLTEDPLPSLVVGTKAWDYQEEHKEDVRTQYIHICTDMVGSNQVEEEEVRIQEEVWQGITYTNPSVGRSFPLHLKKGVTSLSCWGEERDWLLVWS